MGQPSSGEETDNSNSAPKKKFHISPRTIPGAANIANQGAIDWGECGLVAYGCNNTVVVVDTSNIQPIQTLDKHKFIVNRVLWGIGLRARLDLVSADLQGTIVVWDTCKGEARCTLQDGKNAILSMSWLRGFDEGDHCLLALHSPYTLILWDTTAQSKVWSTSYSDSLLSFDVNPFHAGDIAVLTGECILLWNYFSPTKVSTEKPKKFYVSSQAVSSARPSRASFSEERLGTNLRRLVRDMVVGETKPRIDTPMKMRECQQLIYHRAVSNLLLLMYPLEILLLDLHISNIIGIIQLERSSSPLLQIVPTRQRDVMYCLHETGSVSVRVRRRQPTFVGSPLDAPASSVSSVSSVETGSLSGDIFPEVGYEQRCQSEVIRQTKGSRICGVACSPICERRLALFLNTGKVVFLELQPSNAGSDWLFNLKDGVSGANPHQVDNLCDLIPPLLSDAVCSPMRLLCVGLMGVAASPLTALAMCPTCPTRMAKNDPSYQPLLALGTTGGLVQIINIATTAIERELAVHTHPVRGIEWASSQAFLSWSYPNATSGSVRNELTLTHALTGHDITVRSNKGDEAPIDCVRVSPLRQYFIIAQRDGGLELWDLRTLHLIRSVTHSAYTITALEWCPVQKITKSSSIEEKTASNLNVPADVADGDAVVSESFCLSDGDSKLYHFSVENNIVKDRRKFAAKPFKGVVTCLAYKGENVVQGDTEGMLKIWLSSGVVSTIVTNNGPIKKIRFSPMREKNLMLALYVDGVSLFHLNKAYEQKDVLPPKMVGVTDIEWAGPQHPILAMHDGSIRIMDLECTHSASPIETYQFREPPSSPCLLHPHIVTNLQIVLAMRYWESSCEQDADMSTHPPSWHSLSTEDGFTPDQLQAVRQQLSRVDGSILKRLFQKNVLGTAGRSLLLSYLLGDTNLVDFWTIALYYLQVYRAGKQQSDIDDNHEMRISKHPVVAPLDSHHDALCDASTYRRLQMERVALYENKRGDYARTQRVIQELIILGETDRAVQLLLETDLDHPQYHVDAMKACLIATMQTSREAAQSTFKLVATNLIANGKIWEGVQLLCLCSKGLDACHYLLLYGMWDEAVWLAKAVLPPSEAREVLHKWTDHLLNSGRKQQAVLAMLSLGQFERVLEQLSKDKLFARAGLLLQACREFEILPRHNQMDESSPQSELLSRIEMDLTCCLLRIGNRQATIKLGQRLGEHNIKLTREFHKMILENC